MRGFTLVELVTVMIMIGVLSVFVAGRLDFADTFSQRGVRDKAVAGLQFARKTAVAQRRHVCVALTAGNALSFTLDTRLPESAGATFCDGSSSVAMALPVPDRDCAGANMICAIAGVNIAAVSGVVPGGAGFCFDPQGRALDAACAAPATARLSVSGQNDIVVERDTGYVR